jgi:hypothetical protein
LELAKAFFPAGSASSKMTARRIDNFFLHLIEPFSAAGVMIFHALLLLLSSHQR